MKQIQNGIGVVLCLIAIQFLSCDRKINPIYYSNLDTNTNRYMEGVKINETKLGLWIYYSDNSYQIDSVSYYENTGRLKWTKKFYNGCPVVMTTYIFEETKQIIINKFIYERMNGLKSYVYPSYIAGESIYNSNCASCHYGKIELMISDTLGLKKLFDIYSESAISDTMDMSFFEKNNHFKLYYANEIDRESLLMFLRGSRAPSINPDEK